MPRTGWPEAAEQAQQDDQQEATSRFLTRQNSEPQSQQDQCEDPGQAVVGVSRLSQKREERRDRKKAK